MNNPSPNQPDPAWWPVRTPQPGFPVGHPALSPAANNLIGSFGFPLEVVIDERPLGIPANGILGPEAIRCLSMSTVAVQCGPAGANLGAITFADEGTLRMFLALNPTLKAGLATMNGIAFCAWCRWDGQAPFRDFKLKRCGVVVNSPVSVYRNDGTGAFFRGSSISKLPFSSIKWLPEDEEELAHRTRVEQAGPAYVAGKANLNYWALAFIEERRCAYFRDTRLFCFLRDGATLEVTSSDALREVDDFIRERSCRPQDHALLDLLRPRPIKRFLQAVQGVGGCESPMLGPVLAAFIRRNLVPSAGSTVTVREIIERFVVLHKDRLPLLRVATLAPSVPSLVLQQFGTPKSNSVLRDGRAQAGFRGLGWAEKPSTGGAA